MGDGFEVSPSAAATSPRISSLQTIRAASGGVLPAYCAASAAATAELTAAGAVVRAAAAGAAGAEEQPALTAGTATSDRASRATAVRGRR